MQDKPDRIRPGSRVKLHFSITLEDGTLAESTSDDEPMEVIIGQGELHEALERALYGLEPGASQSIKLNAEQGFGWRDPDARHTLSRDEFPPDLDVEPGVIVLFTTPAGDEVAGTVLDVHGNSVEVDFNHPLAGREINFSVEILTVSNERTV